MPRNLLAYKPIALETLALDTDNPHDLAVTCTSNHHPGRGRVTGTLLRVLVRGAGPLPAPQPPGSALPHPYLRVSVGDRYRYTTPHPDRLLIDCNDKFSFAVPHPETDCLCVMVYDAAFGAGTAAAEEAPASLRPPRALAFASLALAALPCAEPRELELSAVVQDPDTGQWVAPAEPCKVRLQLEAVGFGAGTEARPELLQVTVHRAGALGPDAGLDVVCGVAGQHALAPGVPSALGWDWQWPLRSVTAASLRIALRRHRGACLTPPLTPPQTAAGLGDGRCPTCGAGPAHAPLDVALWALRAGAQSQVQLPGPRGLEDGPPQITVTLLWTAAGAPPPARDERLAAVAGSEGSGVFGAGESLSLDDLRPEAPEDNLDEALEGLEDGVGEDCPRLEVQPPSEASPTPQGLPDSEACLDVEADPEAGLSSEAHPNEGDATGARAGAGAGTGSETTAGGGSSGADSEPDGEAGDDSADEAEGSDGAGSDELGQSCRSVQSLPCLDEEDCEFDDEDGEGQPDGEEFDGSGTRGTLIQSRGKRRRSKPQEVKEARLKLRLRTVGCDLRPRSQVLVQVLRGSNLQRDAVMVLRVGASSQVCAFGGCTIPPTFVNAMTTEN